MKKSLYLLLIIIVLALSFNCSKTEKAKVAPAPGHITFLMGTVDYAKTGANWQKAKIGTELRKGYKIKTSDSSFCDIQIGTGSVVRVKANTKISMKKVFFNPASGQENTRLKITVGKLLIKPKKLIKNSSFEVETPTAVCGVRGTKFLVETLDNNETKIAVTEGKVKVRKRIASIDDATEESAITEDINQILEDASVNLTENDSITVDTKATKELEDAVQSVIKKKEANANQDLSKELELLSLTIKKEIRDLAVKPIDIKLKKEVSEVDKIEIIPMNNGILQLKSEVKQEDSTAKIEEEQKPEKTKKIIKLQRIAWKFKAGNTVETKPVVYNGHVYVGSQDQNVYCLDLKGNVIWKKATGQAISCSPVISGDILYIGSNDGKLYAFNAKNGLLKWSKSFGPIVFSRPNIIGNTIYIGTTSNKVYAIDKKTGNKKWEFSTESGIYSTPTLVDGKIVFGCEDNNVYAIDASTGNKVWSYKTEQRIIGSSPAVSGKNIYIGSYDGNLYALKSNGTLLWKYNTGKRIVSSPAISGSMVYIGSGNGILFALNKSTGKLVWKKSIGSKIISTPEIKNGILYIGSYNNKVFALKASNGKVEWSVSVDSSISSSPTFDGENVYIGSDNGNIFSFNTVLEKEVDTE